MRRHAYTFGVAAVCAFALWLRWPTIYNGYFSDDVVAVAMINGQYAAPRSVLDLFDFAAGSAADNAKLLRYGSLPWWTVGGLRLAMLRPLASLLTLLDYRLFGHNPLPCHLHSTLWWVALLLAVAALYRELLPRSIALVALALFALKEGHTFTMGWLANRGGLMAMAFSVLALHAHVRYRRHGQRSTAWLSAGLFTLALASGEWALPIMAYVFAFELMRTGVPIRQRALGLLPAVAPTLVFGVLRATLGYGARNSGVYTDPIDEPLRFARMIFERYPVFFADMTFSVPARYWGFGTPWRDRLLASGLIPPDIWVKLPSWPFWHLIIGSVAIVTVCLVFAYVLPTRPEAERRQLRWLLPGGFLALLPMVSSFTHSRVVIPAALAFAVACASVLHFCWERLAQALDNRRLRGALGTALLCAAVLYFQVWMPGERSYEEARTGNRDFASIRSLILDAEVNFHTLANKRVVLLGTIDHTAMVFAPYVLAMYGKPMPRSWWTLTAAPYATEYYRPAPNVLELTTLGGSMLASEMEALYRAERFRMHVGQVVDLPGLRVEIVRMTGGYPRTVRFTFAKDIDDPSYLFLYSSPEGLGPARLPEVGERLIFRKASFGNEGRQRYLRSIREPNVACVGTRPPLNQCRTGFAFADCHGTGEPLLACAGQNDCRYFLRGCVAEGYSVSSCPPNDTCCHAGWPFAAGSFTRDPPYVQRLYDTLLGWGERARDPRDDFAIDAWIDPAVHTTGPRLHCTGPGSDSGACVFDTVDVAEPHQTSLYLAYRGIGPDPGWALSVELVDDRSGQLQARICRVQTPPQAGTRPPIERCPAAHAPVCAVRGRLVLNELPIEQGSLPALQGELEADFPDGLHVEGQL